MQENMHTPRENFPNIRVARLSVLYALSLSLSDGERETLQHYTVLGISWL